MTSLPYLQTLRAAFGDLLQVDVPLNRYTSARLGGNADVMVTVNSSLELADAAKLMWETGIPFILLGAGSNVLISDAGIRQVVILNRAKTIRFNQEAQQTSVWAESGANLGNLARRAAAYGYSGLEWAAGIPGTVGGAVYGNAGAHGSDMAHSLHVANILQLKQSVGDANQVFLQEEWSAEKFDFEYRCSILKRKPAGDMVLSAELKLSASTPGAVQAKMDEFTQLRQVSQPPGASLGSIFRNPVNDYAGRLIESAGLKGLSIGKVKISEKHANFFINQDGASASDYAELIALAQQKVYEKFGVELELEIELLGDWSRN